MHPFASQSRHSNFLEPGFFSYAFTSVAENASTDLSVMQATHLYSFSFVCKQSLQRNVLSSSGLRGRSSSGRAFGSCVQNGLVQGFVVFLQLLHALQSGLVHGGLEQPLHQISRSVSAMLCTALREKRATSFVPQHKQVRRQARHLKLRTSSIDFGCAFGCKGSGFNRQLVSVQRLPYATPVVVLKPTYTNLQPVLHVMHPSTLHGGCVHPMQRTLRLVAF